MSVSRDVEIREIKLTNADEVEQCAELVSEYSWGRDFPSHPRNEISKSDYLVGAYVDSQLVGCASINRFAAPGGRITGEPWFAHAVILPDHRGQGIMTQLYKNCLTYADGRIEKLFACTDNPIMECFFVKRGWHHVRDDVDESGASCRVFAVKQR